MEPIKPRGGSGMGEFVSRPKAQATINRVQPTTVKHEAAPMQPVSHNTVKRSKKRFKKLRLWWFDSWRPLLIGIIVSLVVSTVLGYRIHSLTHGVSKSEQAYIASIDSGKKMLENSVYLPHKLPTYALHKAGVSTPAAYRTVSALLSVLAVVCGFFILRRWYSLRVAILGSILLLCSSWFLHYARLATPDASYLLLFPLVWLAAWMYHTPKHRLALMSLLAASVLSLYIPMFCWLVVGAIVWQRKAIIAQLKHTEWWFMCLMALAGLILITPLAITTVVNPREALQLIGLPTTLPNISQLGINLGNIPLQLFFRGPDNPAVWLGRLPLLDVFSATMLFLGIYSLRYNLSLIRAKLVVAMSAILILFMVLNGSSAVIAILPICYLLIAGGMAFMLSQWFTIFPRNPIARSIGTTIMSVLVLLVSYYHLNHYFIAWPNTPATKATFSDKTLVK